MLMTLALAAAGTADVTVSLVVEVTVVTRTVVKAAFAAEVTETSTAEFTASSAFN